MLNSSIMTALSTSIASTSPTFTPTSIPITSIPFETLFRKCRTNTFGSEGGSINVNPSCDGLKLDQTIQLSWVVPRINSFAGCTIPMGSIQPEALQIRALILGVRGKYDNELIAIKLKDASREQEKLITLSTDWKQIVLHFLVDFPDIDVQRLKELTIGIAYNPNALPRSGKGSACFTSIGFGSP